MIAGRVARPESSMGGRGAWRQRRNLLGNNTAGRGESRHKQDSDKIPLKQRRNPVRSISCGVLLAVLFSMPLSARDHSTAPWLETSLKRIYPNSRPAARQTLDLDAGRNYQVSFQAALRNDGQREIKIRCEVAGGDELLVRVRRVGYVPVRHLTSGTALSELEGADCIPGFVPDPLFPENEASIYPRETQAFWVTVKVPADAAPGERILTVRLTPVDGKQQAIDNKQKAELPVRLRIHPLVVKPRRDFPVTHWWRTESIYEHYKIEPFGEKWWQLTRKYLDNLIAHGNNVIFVPMWSLRSEAMQRPAQLLASGNLSGASTSLTFRRSSVSSGWRRRLATSTSSGRISGSMEWARCGRLYATPCRSTHGRRARRCFYGQPTPMGTARATATSSSNSCRVSMRFSRRKAFSQTPFFIFATNRGATASSATGMHGQSFENWLPG